MSTPSGSSCFIHPSETAATASDLALGKLVLCGGAHALSPANPDLPELREELVEYGRRAYGLAEDGMRRAVDVVLGTSDDGGALRRVGSLVALGSDADLPGLLHVSARHLLGRRGPGVGPGKRDPQLREWYPDHRGGAQRMRLDVQRWYPVVRGERALGLLEAHRLRLKPSQLAALEQATSDVAAEVAQAIERRRAFMTAVRIRRLVGQLMARSG